MLVPYGQTQERTRFFDNLLLKWVFANETLAVRDARFHVNVACQTLPTSCAFHLDCALFWFI